MPNLDPNELAAKGATLLQHLALWMMEEKRMKEEEEQQQQQRERTREESGNGSMSDAGAATLPLPKSPRSQNLNVHGRSKSALEGVRPLDGDRPDSGFDSKDEEGTPTKNAAAAGAGSSPELGGGAANMSRQALIRQPVLRKRRMNNPH